MRINLKRLARGAMAALALVVPGARGQAPATVAGSEGDIRRDATVEAVEKAMPCVVNIATATIVERNDPYYRMMRDFYGYPRQVREEPAASGSAVIVDEDGYLITNIHVIRGATKIQVKLADGRVYEAQALVGIPNSDVALLRIRSKPGEKFQAIRMAKDDDLLLGETVIAIGNPFGLEGSVARGILSSKSRRQPERDGKLSFENWLQTDAAINPGNSGGALVNVRGDLIGINVAVYNNEDARGMGVGFAIPVKLISAAITEFFTPEDLPLEGRTPVWFGAKFKPAPYPLSITEVRPGTPAEKAGLRPSQLVLQINGKTPRSPMDCAELLLNSPNRQASLIVVENGTRREVKVDLPTFEDFFRQKMGLELSKLTATDVDRFGLSAGDGVFVQVVEPNGPADRAQLRPGFLLSRLDDQPVVDLSAAASLLSLKKSGESVRATVRIPERTIYGYTGWRQGTTAVKIR